MRTTRWQRWLGRSPVAEDTGDVAAETAEIAMGEALVEASLAEEETKDPEFRSFTEPLEDRGANKLTRRGA